MGCSGRSQDALLAENQIDCRNWHSFKYGANDMQSQTGHESLRERRPVQRKIRRNYREIERTRGLLYPLGVAARNDVVCTKPLRLLGFRFARSKWRDFTAPRVREFKPHMP